MLSVGVSGDGGDDGRGGEGEGAVGEQPGDVGADRRDSEQDVGFFEHGVFFLNG